MYPVCFHIGPLPIHWYGVMMALGFLVALANWTYIGRKEGRSFNFCADLLFWIMVSGILGARLAYVVSDFKHFLAQPLAIVRVDQGGLIYYGGVVGSILAIFIFANVRREKTLVVLDLAAISVPVAHAIGRIGCFLNGCCHGREYDGLFAVSYPAKSLAWWLQVDAGRITRLAPRSLSVHPVQLYEATFNLALYFVVMWAYRCRKRNGSVSALYLLIHPAGRFCLEFLRGDKRMRWMGLSIAQLVSIVLFISGCGMLIWLHRSILKRGREA